MKLEKSIITGFGEHQKTISEINIKKEDFTAKILLEAEREFLLMGGIFPSGDMESSRAYLGVIASKIIGCTPDELTRLSALEYIKITNIIKGFFDGLGYRNFLEVLSGKSV